MILNGEKLDNFSLRSGTRQRCPFSPLLFNIILVVLDNEMRRKGNKMYTNLEEIKLFLSAEYIIVN